MKKIFCCLLLMVGMGWQGFSQTMDKSLIPYRSGDTWGFAQPDKKIVIQPVYEDVDWFSEGYAAVKKSGKWGYINKAGKLVIPAKFTVAKPFRKGFMPKANDIGGDSVLFAGASLQKDGYEICINTKGQRMPKCPAIPENDVKENAGPVKQVHAEKNYNLPNSEGLFDKIVDDYKIAGNDETFYVAVKNGLYGVFNSKFETILPFTYSNVKIIRNLSEPYLEVQQNGTVGLFTAEGLERLPADNQSILPIESVNGNHYAITKKDDKYFVMNLDNTETVALGYTDIFYDPQGGFVVTTDNNLKGFYFMDGKKVPAKYVDVQLIPGGDYLLVKTFNGKMGYVNGEGEEFFVE